MKEENIVTSYENYLDSQFKKLSDEELLKVMEKSYSGNIIKEYQNIIINSFDTILNCNQIDENTKNFIEETKPKFNTLISYLALIKGDIINITINKENTNVKVLNKFIYNYNYIVKTFNDLNNNLKDILLLIEDNEELEFLKDKYLEGSSELKLYSLQISKAFQIFFEKYKSINKKIK